MITFKKYITERTQKYSSKGTSVKQIPSTFNRIPFEPNTVNLDIGGGRFDLGTDLLQGKGVTNLIFDPYNRSPQHNTAVLKQLPKNGADTVSVNNVLNVIMEPIGRQKVIKMAKKYLAPMGTAYFLIYQGDGTGEGRITKKAGENSSWQNHLKAIEYLPEIQKVFSNVSRKGNLIIAQK